VRALAGVAVVAALALGSSAGAAASGVALTIAVWEDGSLSSPPRTWTLRCGPVGGTLPGRRNACRRLAGGGAGLFSPIPRDALCTEIYGGPQVALVRGRIAERRVWARFARTDGCQIARWSRVAFLFPIKV
jgi:hypothetical protein